MRLIIGMIYQQSRGLARRGMVMVCGGVLAGLQVVSSVTAGEPRVFYAADDLRWYKIDTRTKVVIASVQIPARFGNRDGVSDIAVSANNKLLYVVNDASPTLVYDTQTLKLQGEYTIESDSDLKGVDHLFVHPRRGSIWFAEPGGSWKQRIGVVDPSTYTVVKTIAPSSARTNKFFDNPFDGNVIAAGDDTSVINAKTFEINRVIDANALGEYRAQQFNMTMHKGANQAIIFAEVVNYKPYGEWRSLYRFDLAQWKLIARSSLTDITGMWNMTENETGTRLFAAIGMPEDRKAVGIFDTETLKLIKKVSLPFNVATGGFYNAPDGKGIWISPLNQGGLGYTNEEIQELKTERGWPVYRLDGDTGELIETLYFPFPMALMAMPH